MEVQPQPEIEVGLRLELDQIRQFVLEQAGMQELSVHSPWLEKLENFLMELLFTKDYSLISPKQHL